LIASSARFSNFSPAWWANSCKAGSNCATPPGAYRMIRSSGGGGVGVGVGGGVSTGATGVFSGASTAVSVARAGWGGAGVPQLASKIEAASSTGSHPGNRGLIIFTVWTSKKKNVPVPSRTIF
jgi:hypothetical protein